MAEIGIRLFSVEMRKEINRDEFLAGSKIAQFRNNHWRRKADREWEMY